MTLTPLERAVVADLLGADLAAVDGEAIAAAAGGLRADTELFRVEAMVLLERVGADGGGSSDD
ncbi:hypothetical protein ACFU0W_04950 [Microbacterium keratanolyticum]|uniref:hypothetical protein n=1 Tax=Microbacterium keratanolyticum TaxID=67574 RepID=UPI00362C0259